MVPATRLPTSSPAVTYRYKEIENVVEGGVHLDLYLPKEDQYVRGSPCPVGSSLLPHPSFSLVAHRALKVSPGSSFFPSDQPSSTTEEAG